MRRVEPHPIRLAVEDDLQRNRLTVFFRLLLAIPHFIWITLWSIAMVVVAVVNWFAVVIAGRLPGGLHGWAFAPAEPPLPPLPAAPAAGESLGGGTSTRHAAGSATQPSTTNGMAIACLVMCLREL